MPAKVAEADTVSWTATGQIEDSSSSELTYRCSSTEKVVQGTPNVGCTSNRRSSTASKKIKYGQQHGSHMDAELGPEYDMVKAQALFTQTAFEQYKPDVIPTIISVRFDKKDRGLGRFWVVNKSIFTTVERVLKENAKKITGFPLLRQRLDEDVPLRAIPCVVRTRAESAYKAFYRAVPSRYDTRTKRFSIFLVDFGWFKWVLANDVIDISTMDMSNPIRKLQVAMIHCQEDVTSALHAKDLSKGENCYMKVKGSLIQDVYLVDLLKAHSTMNDLLTGSMEETGEVSASKLINETCERQLMASMMLGTLNTANRDLAQSQHIWPHCCPPQFSMMMPVALPMIPVPVPNTNLPAVGNEQIPRLQNLQTRSSENTHVPQSNAMDSACSRNYIHPRENGMAATCREEIESVLRQLTGQEIPLMKVMVVYLGSRHPNLQRITACYETAVAADRAFRTQRFTAGEQAAFHVDDELNRLT
uniref:Reverse transcriptase Ty1/copia-type domain-containing protein n=1 Tax=Loa loa TaxID=7209 RepID=A0A1I7VAW5_LOALO